MFVPRRTAVAPRLPSLVRSALGVLVALGVAAACTEPGIPAGRSEERPASAPLSAYDADGPALAPRGPCTGLTAGELADALGGDVETSLTWAPGQRLPGTSEVADEYGCRHTAGTVTASAWVFAAPTARAHARRLVRDATGQQCCRLRAAETFGDPGVAYRCERVGSSSLTGMRGLVGDTWVSCEIRGTDDAVRVSAWCQVVLRTLAAS